MEYLGTQNQDKSYATKDLIASALNGYYTDTQVDELYDSAINEVARNRTRVYLNPTRVTIASSSETNSSTTSTSGTLCYNVSTGHILYKVGTTYYNGSFYHSGYPRAAQAGDVVLFTSDTYTATMMYVHNGTNFVLAAMDYSGDIEDLESSIGSKTAVSVNGTFRTTASIYAPTTAGSIAVTTTSGIYNTTVSAQRLQAGGSGPEWVNTKQVTEFTTASTNTSAYATFANQLGTTDVTVTTYFYESSQWRKVLIDVYLTDTQVQLAFDTARKSQKFKVVMTR